MRGEAKVQILNPNYKVADLSLNKRILKEGILSILGVADLDFHRLWYALDKTHWAKTYGITQENWKTLRRDYGVSIVNPLIEVLDELIDEGKIGKRIDYRAEGCCAKTPRFMYNII
jgi:hypothetical protein